MVDLQSTEEVHQVPGLFRLEVIGEGRHGRSIQTRHKDFVQVLVGLAALKARTLGKVVRTDRLIVVVGQCGGGRTVPMAFLAVAFPAFHFCEEFFPVFDAVHRQGRFRRYADGRARLFVLPAWRKGLDEGHQVGALLVGQRLPGRHIGVIEAARDSLEEILVGWQSAGGRRATLKLAGENVKVRGVLAVAVAADPVTTPAIAIVKLFPGAGMPRPFADMGFLSRRGPSHRQHGGNHQGELICFAYAHCHPPQ